MRIKVQEGLPNLLHDHGQLNNRTDYVRRGNLESGPWKIIENKNRIKCLISILESQRLSSLWSKLMCRFVGLLFGWQPFLHSLINYRSLVRTLNRFEKGELCTGLLNRRFFIIEPFWFQVDKKSEQAQSIYELPSKISAFSHNGESCALVMLEEQICFQRSLHRV
jgi:hypothetical protein